MKMTLKELVEKVNEKLDDLGSLKNEDSRIKNVLSERRIRSYIYNGVLHKPIRLNGEIYYDETHLEKLLAIRGLQNIGMSESTIKSMSMSSPFPQENVATSLNYGSPLSVVSDNVDLSSIEGKKAALSSFLFSVSSSSKKNTDDNVFPSVFMGFEKLDFSDPIFPVQAQSQSQSLNNSLLSGATGSGIVSSQNQGDGNQASNYISDSLASVSKISVKSVQEYVLDDFGKISLRIEDGVSVSNPRAVLDKIKKILNIKED